ncbi:RagB/SusD family nutrient uptake outer membrane protein [Sphingobacterium lumbrici]|uniref:RagB/SusD family nutrient uptake outer membrane protein n=1 Tax=Sphingobacterium lumbrici TaxID=2559600 RepID=UPI00112DF512|nr:RagB/SusD family nutrient uptake outer membrane protein [Sphingobacterium lumbrici]
MKKIIYLFILISFASCQKWLDVKPEDKFIEEDAFSSPEGFATALNGIYLKLAASNMYGGELTMNGVDLLAQYYYVPEGHPAAMRGWVAYHYEEEEAKVRIDNIWKNQYSNITNINKFISNIETWNSVLDPISRDIYKGEALALRAYLYFDLLRLFAPSYTENPLAARIPYYDEAGYVIAPFSTSESVVAHILEDLRQAEELLKKDPVLQLETVDIPRGIIGESNWKTRNNRLNFYAVKGLQARVNLYIGNNEDALAAAKRVIQDQSKFPWINADQVNNENLPNRIFSTEILFQFENPKLYEYYNANFGSSVTNQTILSSGPDNSFLRLVYENWENDFRYSPSWKIEGGKTFPLFIKYKDVTSKDNVNFRFKVPGIRLSEMFLIAAETESNPNEALSYLNELRIHRNCIPLTSTNLLMNAIQSEYAKEFYGEGQMWFFYKRKSAPAILSASTLNMEPINIDDYTLPIPLSETENR